MFADADDEGYPFVVPAGAVRPGAAPGDAERAYAGNLLAALARTVDDRCDLATREVLGRTRHSAAAVTTLLWYPDRPVGFLAERLRISPPGAVQLAQRLADDGLVERVGGADGRTTLLALTQAGERAALGVLAARRSVVAQAVSALDDDRLAGLVTALEVMLGALTDDLLTGESMCRLCDELACPDERCPVERAEPAPPSRRGLGYGVPRPAGEA
jgi:MarR family transcriptional regulator, negative regulator of the multidrug operon emrRAB